MEVPIGVAQRAQAVAQAVYNGLLPPHGRMDVNESCHVHASMFLIPFNYCTEALVEQDQYIVLWCFSFGSDWL